MGKREENLCMKERGRGEVCVRVRERGEREGIGKREEKLRERERGKVCV